MANESKLLKFPRLGGYSRLGKKIKTTDYYTEPVEKSSSYNSTDLLTLKNRKRSKMKQFHKDTSQIFTKILLADSEIKKLAAEFLSEKIADGLQDSTAEKYLQMFKAFHFLRLKDFDRCDFTEWISETVSGYKWEKTTLCNRLRQLAAFNRWLFYNNYVLRLHRAPRMSNKPKRRELPTREEWELLFDFLRERYETASLGRRRSRWRDYLVARILFETGIRVSEAANLLVKDLVIHDAETFYLFINGTKSEDAERAVLISETLTDEIRAYLWTFKIQNKSARMFSSKSGGGFDTIEFCKFIKAFSEKLGIEATITPHVFRHNFILMFIADGGSALDLQARLGHSDIKMTVYYFNQVRRLLPFVKTNADISIFQNRVKSRAAFFQRKNYKGGEDYD